MGAFEVFVIGMIVGSAITSLLLICVIKVMEHIRERHNQ